MAVRGVADLRAQLFIAVLARGADDCRQAAPAERRACRELAQQFRIEDVEN
jgi:hypothetical protein